MSRSTFAGSARRSYSYHYVDNMCYAETAYDLAAEVLAEQGEHSGLLADGFSVTLHGRPIPEMSVSAVGGAAGANAWEAPGSRQARRGRGWCAGDLHQCLRMTLPLKPTLSAAWYRRRCAYPFFMSQQEHTDPVRCSLLARVVVPVRAHVLNRSGSRASVSITARSSLTGEDESPRQLLKQASASARTELNLAN